MTYEAQHHDPDAEPMLCNDEELADMGFTVVDGNETPDPGREPLEADADAYLAAADLESADGCAQTLHALHREIESEADDPQGDTRGVPARPSHRPATSSGAYPRRGRQVAPVARQGICARSESTSSHVSRGARQPERKPA